MNIVALLISFLLVSSCRANLTPKGVIELDEKVFDLIVDGSKPVVVSFQEHGWKNPKDYENVVQEFDGQGIIFVKVDCAINKELTQRFNIENYPSIRYFAKGQTTNPAIYSGPDTSSDITDFIRVQMNPKLNELKQLAVKFFAESSSRKSILASAESIVNGLEAVDKEYANFFVNNMKKILEKGEQFVELEKERLGGLLGNKATTEKKKQEFSRRLNVLNAFSQTIA